MKTTKRIKNKITMVQKCPPLSHFVLPEYFCPPQCPPRAIVVSNYKKLFSLRFVLPWERKALVLLGICPPLGKKNQFSRIYDLFSQGRTFPPLQKSRIVHHIKYLKERQP